MMNVGLAVSSLSHPQRVRLLYKTILQLHRGLPPALAELGNKYVKEEFHRHKNCRPEFVQPFMLEWSSYAMELSKQIRDASYTPSNNPAPNTVEFGRPLEPTVLNRFSESQLQQLLSLAEEIHSRASSTDEVDHN
ncbi:hypothetical protein FGIG_10447 [Fasciola gigantica]|uniref:Succinate dehydrogenase assembly factor 3 n=1 Tax=Fasciola gigantica TaxID=46835 RepID=A0A504YE11_FASGI|nr:hypothetical protein FGIG_10447 [Fasciola gigantica]